MRVSDMLQAHHITNVSSPGDLTLDWGKQFQPLDTLHKQVCAYLRALTNASDPAHVHIGIEFSDVINVNAVAASGLMRRVLSVCVCLLFVCLSGTPRLPLPTRCCSQVILPEMHESPESLLTQMI